MQKQEDVVNLFKKLRGVIREEVTEGCSYASVTIKTSGGNIVAITFAERNWTLYFLSGKFGKEATFVFSPRDNSIKNFVRECYLELRQIREKEEFVAN